MTGKGDGKGTKGRSGPKDLPHEHWKDEPEEHDFPDAGDYLTLVADDATRDAIVEALRSAATVHGKAKDLLRASRLPLLGLDNAHVANDLAKVRRGERLSPVLLVRGSARSGAPLTVADGYHRICASYQIDENAVIPFRIVDLQASTG